MRKDKRFGNIKNKTKPPGHSTLMCGYLNTKHSATRRKYAFHLTFEDFSHIVQQNCYYCNRLPPLKNKYCDAEGNLHKGKKKHKYSKFAIERAWVRSHGVDRLDNSKGYIDGNCVSCCGHCNLAKKDRSHIEFIKHCYEIITHYERQFIA